MTTLKQQQNSTLSFKLMAVQSNYKKKGFSQTVLSISQLVLTHKFRWNGSGFPVMRRLP